jgi:hypothetical protein
MQVGVIVAWAAFGSVGVAVFNESGFCASAGAWLKMIKIVAQKNKRRTRVSLGCNGI